MVLAIFPVNIQAVTLSFNQMSGDLETLLLKNSSQGTPEWIKTIPANGGDLVRFSLYYHCGADVNSPTKEQALNTKVKIIVPTGLQTQVVPSVRLSADNAAEATDTATINITSPQKLIFKNTATWFHNSISQEISLTTGDGFVEANIGNIPCDWQTDFSNAGFINFSAQINAAPVADAGINKDIFESQTVILQGSGSDLDGDPITFSWNCTGGSLSDSHIAQPVFTPPAITVDTSYSCTLTVTDVHGSSASDSMNVLVRKATLGVELTVNPSSGTVPLNDVSLTAKVTGSLTGPINYIFYCNRSDSGTNITSGWASRTDGTDTNPLIANNICDYTQSGTYTAKVIVERDPLAVEKRIPVVVEEKIVFNAMAGDAETILLKNRTQNTPEWVKTISANADDVIRFSVYYHAGVNAATPPSQPARNTRIKITVPSSLETQIVPRVRIYADNAVETVDSSTAINVSSAQKLVFENTAKWDGPNGSSDIPVTIGSAEVNLGDIPGDPTGTFGNAGYVTFVAKLTKVYANSAPVANAGPDKEVLEGQAVTLAGSATDVDGDSLTYSWTCTGGSLSNQSVIQPVYTAPWVTTDTTYTCTLTVNDSKGAKSSDNVNLLVKKQTLAVSLAANPTSGTAPLDNVGFTADVSGTAIGTINYIFYCNRTDSGINVTSGWAHKVDASNVDPLTVTGICHYTVAGTYTAKVVVERGPVAAEDRQTIVVSASSQPAVDIKANGADGPITIPLNSSATLTWNSNNTTACTASNGWSGTKATTGTESTGNLTASKTYTITCTSSAGSATDSVTVNLESTQNHTPTANAGPDKEVYENQTVTLSGSGSDPDGDPITYSWSCSGGSLSSSQIAQPVFTAPGVSRDTSYTCTLVIADNKGASASDSLVVMVRNHNSPPTVDIKANGFDSSITVPYNAVANLTWTSTDATSCTASGNWSGTKPTSGSESTGSLTYSKAYILTCTGTDGSATDSVIVNVESSTPNNSPIVSAGVDREVYEGQTVILQGTASDPDNDPLTYSWYCSGGTLSSYSVLQPVYTAPLVNSDTIYTCILSVFDNRGGSNSDSVLITVRDQNIFSVSLTANPNSGPAPLNNVSFTADVSGNATGTINYIFYCNRADTGTNVTSGWAYRLDATTIDPLTVNNVCSYPTAGSYTAKVIVERGGMATENRVTINVYSGGTVTVDLKVNGFDGPITIPYNAAVTLSWTSTNTTSCNAFSGWTGTRAVNGSESTGNLTASKTYTISCTGVGGSATDSVVVNVESSILTTSISVRNVTDNGSFSKSVTAKPLDKLEFSIKVTANANAQNVNVRATLPTPKLLYEGNAKVDNVAHTGNVIYGISLGNLTAGQSKTITFDGSVANENQFNYGLNNAIATAIAYNTSTAVSDSATVQVNRTAVAGAATGVKTGITDSLVDYLLIPSAIASSLVWLFRKYLLIIDQWIEKKKTALMRYKTEKDLRKMISRIRIRERFNQG